MKSFSVLMSVYAKENPIFLEQAIQSVLKQTVKPSKIIIVKDGMLTEKLESLLNQFSANHPDLFLLHQIEKNVGLGLALNQGLLLSQHELIARMDSDDIAVENRFEKQLQAFQDNPNLSLHGGYIIEFENDIDEPISKRAVPLNKQDIYTFAKKRNPFNHMTVMYKKQAVLDAGNYQHKLGAEDYYLWVKMLVNNIECSNTNEVLVYARVGNDMHKKRGGMQYLKNILALKKEFKQIGFYSNLDYLISSTASIISCLMPNFIRKFIYNNLLRKN